MENSKFYLFLISLSIIKIHYVLGSNIATIAIPVNDRNKYVQLYHTERFKIDYESVLETTELKFKCENPARDCANNGVCNESKDDCVCNNGYYSFKSSFIN